MSSVKSGLAQTFNAGGMSPGQLSLLQSAATSAGDLDPTAPPPIHGLIQVVLSGPRVLGFGIRAVSKAVGGRPLASNGDFSCLRHQGHRSTGECLWPLPVHSSSGDMSASHVPLFLSL